MDTERLRFLAEFHRDVAVNAGKGPADLTREFAALALEAAAALEQPAPVVAVPDDVAQTIRQKLMDMRVIGTSHMNKYQADEYRAEIDAVLAWLDANSPQE